MHNTVSKEKLRSLLIPEICNRLFRLHEYRGRQNILASGKLFLDAFRQDVAIDSVNAVCVLEQRKLPNQKFDIHAIQSRHRHPTGNEAAAAGYFDTFQILEAPHGIERFNVERIVEIHTELFFMYSDYFEQTFRTCELIKFSGLPAPAETLPHEKIESTLSSLVSTYIKMHKQKTFDEILLISVFLVDFLCIYPYKEGFTRLFLLIARLLLKRAGYLAVDYVSFESEFAKNQKDLQDAVFNSTVLWNKGENDYSYFTVFMLDTLLSVYEKYETYLKTVPAGQPDAKELVKTLLEIKRVPMSRQDFSRHITSVTPDRIKQILRELTDEGFLMKAGKGKKTVYKMNNE